MKTFFTLLLLTLIMCGCSAPAGGDAGHAISQGQAVTIAQEKLTQEHINAKEYKFSVLDKPSGNRWIIVFERSRMPQAPGDSIFVWVDKQTGKTEIMRGQ